jgi:Actin
VVLTVRSLNIGGKFLTNYLKEIISYRQYNMMDETHLINKVKESTSLISQDFSHDLEFIKKKRGSEVKYVLPDYSNSKEGYILREGQTIREDQQVLVLGNERFAVPELLFTPSDVGIYPYAYPFPWIYPPFPLFPSHSTGSFPSPLAPVVRLLALIPYQSFRVNSSRSLSAVLTLFYRLKTRRSCRGSNPINKLRPRRIQIAIICEYHSCWRKYPYPRFSRKTPNRSPFLGPIKLPRPDNHTDKVIPRSRCFARFPPPLSLPYLPVPLPCLFPHASPNDPFLTLVP